MYRIAVCDDVPAILQAVSGALEAGTFPRTPVLRTFSSGAALAAELRAGTRFDLLILDIELDQVSGIAVGRLVREELRDAVTQILYISGKRQYAMELFDLRPLNFLLKPIDPGKLTACVRQAMELARPGECLLSYTAGRNRCSLPARQIRYVESYHRRITLHTVEGPVECRDRLEALAAQLPPRLFLRIHQSFLVNLLYVRSFRYDRLTLDDGRELSISQSYRRSVRESLLGGGWEGGEP